MQESRDRASSDGRAPLVASLLESARTKGRKMLCASPDHQLVHVQAAVCGPQNRQYQTSGTTCRIRVYRWRKKYGGLGVSELRELKQLKEENRKLKQLVADLSLDKSILQEALRKKW